MSKLVPVEALKEWLEKNWMLGKNSIDRVNKIMLLSELEKDRLPTIDLDKIIEGLKKEVSGKTTKYHTWDHKTLEAVQQAVKKAVEE